MLFEVGKKGTPITIIDSQYFSLWLDQQPESKQRWLRSINYQGQGLCLVADAQGQLSEVVFGVDGVDRHYACSDLATQLPPGQYRIEQAFDEQGKSCLNDELLSVIAFSWAMGAYCFDRYKTAESSNRSANKPADKPSQESPQLLLPMEELRNQVECDVSAITLVRDLINTPASDMMPKDLADCVDRLGKTYDADVHHIEGDDLLAQNYPTIHAVGRASENAPRLIDLRWGDPSHPKLTLVGKGVCFDSGGLDVKTSTGMRNMKKDMGGAANVIGLAQLIMSHQLPVRLRLLIPAVENAIAHNAYRPGDVIKTRKGLTVEIDNTDAEGRLVLCDALAEADTEAPDLLIDMATLTGTCRIALGTELPGLFTNRSDLAALLCQAGESVSDPVWPLPLHAPYKEYLKSNIADLVNCPPTPMGGAIVAALYLQSFVSDSTSWCHFDIMGWNTRALPGRPIGGEAMGLRAVFKFLQEKYS